MLAKYQYENINIIMSYVYFVTIVLHYNEEEEYKVTPKFSHIKNLAS